MASRMDCGHIVRVHDGPAVHVARGAADRLDQRAAGAQEAFLVGVQNRHQRHLREIETLAQQVDADQDVELALPQVAQDLNALERVDIRVEVADLHPQLLIVLRQVLRHPLGQRRDEHPLACRRARADLGQQIVHLAADRPHLDDGIEQAGRPDDLLDDGTP